MNALSIGRIAQATDVKVPTIRFYEQIGLMPQAQRSESDRRIYDNDAVRRLAFIKHARQLGFPIDSIRSLLDLADDPHRACDEANRLAAAQLADVEQKILRLQSLKIELQRMLDAGCRGETSACRVIEVLSDHRLCQASH